MHYVYWQLFTSMTIRSIVKFAPHLHDVEPEHFIHSFIHVFTQQEAARAHRGCEPNLRTHLYIYVQLYIGMYNVIPHLYTHTSYPFRYQKTRQVCSARIKSQLVCRYISLSLYISVNRIIYSYLYKTCIGSNRHNSCHN